MTAAISTLWNWQLPVLLVAFNESVICSLGIEHLQEIHGLSRSKFPSDTAFLLALGKISLPFPETYLFQTFTHQMICVHPTDAQEILHFPERFTWTPGLFYFGFSAHTCDMCFIFASASHIYSGHLSTTLFVYILQMFQKFCIFLGHLPAHHGCFSQVFCIFSQDNYLDTRVVFLSGFPHIPGTFTCVYHIYSRHLPTKLFVHIFPMLWTFCLFPRTITQTPGLFFLGVPHIPGTCNVFLHVCDIFI